MSLIFQQLVEQLKDTDANLTITEALLKKNRESYNLAVKQKVNITLSQIQMLAHQCQLQICNLSCLPDLRREFCRRQRQVHLINQNCFCKISARYCTNMFKLLKTVLKINM